MLRPSQLIIPLVFSVGSAPNFRAPVDTQSPAYPLLRIEASDFAFRAPATARAGFTRVRLVNHGPSPHHVLFTKVADTASFATVYRILTTTVVNVLVKDWGGPNITAPGDSSEAIVELKPVRYSLECWVMAADKKSHVMKGRITMLQVAASSGPAVAEPKADLVLRAADYRLDFNAPVTRGHHLVRFENAGPQEHDVQIVKLRRGESMKQILAWAEAGLVGAPPVGELAGGTVGIDRGNRVWFPLDLAPGGYAMFCFVPDAQDEKPHLLHGMWRELSVR